MDKEYVMTHAQRETQLYHWSCAMVEALLEDRPFDWVAPPSSARWTAEVRAKVKARMLGRRS